VSKVQVRAQSFWTPKGGNTPRDYEDAFWPVRSVEREAGGFQFAVADGATESSYSGIWARQLVRALCTNPSRPLAASFMQELPALQKRWRSAVSWRPLPWYAEQKLQAGAFAAMLGLQLRGANVTGTWHAIAMGDSCLFHLRADGLLNSFPVADSRCFNNRPRLISTNPAYNSAAAAYLRAITSTWQSGDSFYLMTDALACWFLGQVETGGNPCRILQSFDRNDQVQDFSSFVQDSRNSKLMRNDDVTFVRIDLL
jgi:hypothetical protein